MGIKRAGNALLIGLAAGAGAVVGVVAAQAVNAASKSGVTADAQFRRDMKAFIRAEIANQLTGSGDTHGKRTDD